MAHRAIAFLPKRSGFTVPKKKKKKAPSSVPRLGPPVNLRPAGAHQTERDRPRGEIERKALDQALREEGTE